MFRIDEFLRTYSSETEELELSTRESTPQYFIPPAPTSLPPFTTDLDSPASSFEGVYTRPRVTFTSFKGHENDL